MNERSATNGGTTDVTWRHASPERVPPPIIRTLPYLEMKLEHPDVEPTVHGERFFPDAVPYVLDGTSRVFYWRPSVSPSSEDPGSWELACATTHELVGIDTLPSVGPPLVTDEGAGTAIVVEGTIAGDVTTNNVTSYTEPEITIEARHDSGIELTVAGTDYEVSTGERRRISLPEQHVEPRGDGAGETSVTPQLVVRNPGQRELHHPAVDASYRLFPSFGLTLGAVPNPLSVPTAAGELDDAALAADLGVDLSQRPYPERVLWQAFAYSAFDPHDDGATELTQLQSGHLVLS